MAEFSNLTDNITDIFNNQTENGTSLDINKHIIRPRPVFSFKGFIIFLIDILVATGPSLGYFLQSLKFKQTKSSKGFSKSLCLIMYVSQILRVFFWIGKPFKITLLYQSILIIVFQVYLIHLWVKYHDTKPANNTNQINDIKTNDKKEIIEYFIDWSDTISPNKIWNWSNSIEYFKFMFLIIIFMLLICGVIGIHNPILVNIIGTISVIAEASTLIPQIIVSFRKKEASNLSMPMVALWFFGDTCKFIYNIIYKTPIQMIASGGVQICLDFVSLMQIICYKNNNDIHYKSTDETYIPTVIANQNVNKVQQINQFMNKLEERFSEEAESNKNSKREENKNEEKEKEEKEEKENEEKENEENENENHFDKNDSKRNINKVEIEVLDKSKHDNIQDNSDDENEKDENNLRKETQENLSGNKDENKNEEEKKEDINN